MGVGGRNDFFVDEKWLSGDSEGLLPSLSAFFTTLAFEAYGEVSVYIL